MPLSRPAQSLAPALDPVSAINSACLHCGEPRPDDRTRYCSRKCERRAKNERRRAAGLSYYDPRPTLRTPYEKFWAATLPGKRVQVPETDEAQQKAELLVARGCCAYRNAKGFIRDIGVPRKEEHRGKVWARSKEVRKGAA